MPTKKRIYIILYTTYKNSDFIWYAQCEFYMQQRRMQATAWLCALCNNNNNSMNMKLFHIAHIQM